MKSTSLSSASQKLEVYDELDIRNKPEIRNQFDIDERVLFSATLTKINKRLDEQERILIITTKFIYNIQPESNLLTKVAFFIAPNASVKRKIPLNKIWGFSISSYHLNEQFVIHITDDYDYRYEAKGKTEKVLRSLCNAYFKHVNSQFPIYIREDKDLSVYQTTDDDFKLGVSKKPKDGKILINQEILDKGLVWMVENRFDLIKQSSMQSGTCDMQQKWDSIQKQCSQNQKLCDSAICLTTSSTISQQNLPQPQQNDNVVDYRRTNTNPFQQFVAPKVEYNQDYQVPQQNNGYSPQGYNPASNPSPSGMVPPQTSYNPIEELVRADWSSSRNTNINFGVELNFENNMNTENRGNQYINN